MDLEQKLETVREKLDTAVEKAADRAEEAAEQLSQEVFTEQVRVRREKLAALQEEGHDPFTITKYPVNAWATWIKAEYAARPEDDETPGPRSPSPGD